jgi:hypothetical protein
MKTIIEMARETLDRMASDGHCRAPYWTATDEELERFAELVRADEREAWEHKYARLQSLMEIRETQPNKPCCLAEREAIAKMVEPWLLPEYVEKIRARGNT